MASSCSQVGDTCLFFDLERVEYSDAQCELKDGNVYEIRFSVRGRKQPNKSALHNYKAKVIEQGKPKHMLAEFAQKTNQAFTPGYSEEADNLSSGGFAKITFLVKKANQPLSGQRGIVVDCTFSHGTNLIEDTWCLHQASIVLTVI